MSKHSMNWSKFSVLITGEEQIFGPKIPSVRIVDLAEAIAPGCQIKEIGVLPGEKINESLLIKNEARHSLEFKDFFVIEPEHPWWVGLK